MGINILMANRYLKRPFNEIGKMLCFASCIYRGGHINWPWQ